MRRFLFLGTALLLVSATAFAQHYGHAGHRGRNISFDDFDATADCSALRASFDGERAAVVTEDVPAGNLRSLRIRSDQNGGIRVFGTTGSAYSVKACKAVAPGTDASQVRVALSGDEVSATGPDDDNWMVYFIVQAPRNATLDLSSTNGPIGVRDFDGTLHARAQNGPLALKNSSGTIDAVTVNGPIAIDGGSGNVKLSATNGPVSVKLAGTNWNGGNLDASTQNGPVTLKLPRGYQSGVVVESMGHGPVSCHAEGCESARVQMRSDRAEYDQPRRIELGSGAAAVHLSTVNGPINVKDRD